MIESFGGGGAQHVASALANHWVENGVSVEAITFSKAETDVFSPTPASAALLLTAVWLRRMRLLASSQIQCASVLCALRFVRAVLTPY